MGDYAVDKFILPPIPIIQAPMAGGITTPALVKAMRLVVIVAHLPQMPKMMSSLTH